jgi:hypothetical protein
MQRALKRRLNLASRRNERSEVRSNRPFGQGGVCVEVAKREENAGEFQDSQDGPGSGEVELCSRASNLLSRAAKLW